MVLWLGEESFCLFFCKGRGVVGWLVFDRGQGGHSRPLVLEELRKGDRGGRCAGEVSLWGLREERMMGVGVATLVCLWPQGREAAALPCGEGVRLRLEDVSWPFGPLWFSFAKAKGGERWRLVCNTGDNGVRGSQKGKTLGGGRGLFLAEGP